MKNYFLIIYYYLFWAYCLIYINKYQKSNLFSQISNEIKEYSNKNGFMYVIDEEPFLKNPTGKPIIINYFYHEKIRQSSRNK